MLCAQIDEGGFAWAWDFTLVIKITAKVDLAAGASFAGADAIGRTRSFDGSDVRERGGKSDGPAGRGVAATDARGASAAFRGDASVANFDIAAFAGLACADARSADAASGIDAAPIDDDIATGHGGFFCLDARSDTRAASATFRGNHAAFDKNVARGKVMTAANRCSGAFGGAVDDDGIQRAFAGDGHRFARRDVNARELGAAFRRGIHRDDIRAFENEGRVTKEGEAGPLARTIDRHIGESDGRFVRDGKLISSHKGAFDGLPIGERAAFGEGRKVDGALGSYLDRRTHAAKGQSRGGHGHCRNGHAKQKEDAPFRKTLVSFHKSLLNPKVSFYIKIRARDKDSTKKQSEMILSCSESIYRPFVPTLRGLLRRRTLSALPPIAC